MWIILAVMIAFSVLHSLLAGQNVKQAVRKRLGERAYYGLYRLAYNALSAVLLLPAAAALVFAPGQVVWAVENDPALLLRVLQGIGLSGLCISLLQIDLGQFSGLSQLAAYLNGRPLPLPAEPLQVNGVYRLVRHPLYLFSLMVIWPMPVMTESMLAFNIASTLYFVFGSILEERRLTAIFGQAYVDYQRRVPWLIPLPRLRRS